MSNLSIIAHDYALNADFAQRFNNAVLNLKRFYLLGRVPTGEAESAIEESRSDLKRLLKSLVLALEDEDKPWTPEQAQVPVDVIDGLRNRLKSELHKTLSDLRQVLGDLGAGAPLRDSSFSALDRVCEAADATASAAFRRLRRI